MPKAITLLSGGMDSVTLLYYIRDKGYDVHALSFDYGQRHKKEIAASVRIAEETQSTWDLISLRLSTYSDESLATLLSGSSLTDSSVPVPDGHYAEETMKATVVPNRNAIMLSIAYGVAVAEKAELVAFAAHAGDHAIYPDCRPIFVGQLDDALKLGNEWADPLPEIRGPFLEFSKAQIVTVGQGLGVPWDLTWTCYKGGDIHCGRCGTCVERKEAFRLAKVIDPTTYDDPTYLIPSYVGE